MIGRPARLPPQGAWDSHCHVMDEDRFPLHASHPYRPRKAAVTELQRFHETLGITHACIVSVSVYHDDQSSILDALTHLKGTACAAVTIEPRTIRREELDRLHQAGARAIRVNLKSRGDSLDLEEIKLAAEKIRPLGWVLQVYLSLDQVAQLAPAVSSLGVPVVIDHLASPSTSSSVPVKMQPGYKEFLQLLRSGQVWTKMSGAYRFADLPDLDEYVLEILSVAPDRVVWASDWPHTAGKEANPDGDRNKVQEFREYDDAAWVDRCWSWCEAADISNSRGENIARKIWVDNPKKLWQYHCNKNDAAA